jgi:hypothetical protein
VKKLKPKLSLSRQTIRLLLDEKLVDVGGGGLREMGCSLRASGCSTFNDSRCCMVGGPDDLP